MWQELWIFWTFFIHHYPSVDRFVIVLKIRVYIHLNKTRILKQIYRFFNFDSFPSQSHIDMAVRILAYPIVYFNQIWKCPETRQNSWNSKCFTFWMYQSPWHGSDISIFQLQCITNVYLSYFFCLPNWKPRYYSFSKVLWLPEMYEPNIHCLLPGMDSWDRRARPL